MDKTGCALFSVKRYILVEYPAQIIITFIVKTKKMIFINNMKDKKKFNKYKK